MSTPLTTTTIFNLPIFTGSFKLLTNYLKGNILTSFQQKTYLIATPNPEQIVLSKEKAAFLETLNQFDLLLPDGVGLVKASRWLYRRKKIKRPIKQRITGIDLASWLLVQASKKNLKVLVIGGQNLADKEFKLKGFKFKLKKLKATSLPLASKSKKPNSRSNAYYPVYWTAGYLDKQTPTEKEQTTLLQLLTKFKPDLVLVAFGADYQETWLVNHLLQLEKNQVKLAMVVGGAMDMLTGKIRRAPVLVQRFGLEWLWRLMMQPWRVKRQLKLVKFLWLTLLAG